MVKFYVLRSKHTDKVYVGQTIQRLLNNRLSGHKYNFNNHDTMNYCTSGELFKLGVSDVKIHLLEEIECEDKKEISMRERYWCDYFGDKIVNKHRPSRSTTEYYNDNKEIIKEKGKIYFEENKEIIREHDRQRSGNDRHKTRKIEAEKKAAEKLAKRTPQMIKNNAARKVKYALKKKTTSLEEGLD
jgi:hypothetical protein